MLCAIACDDGVADKVENRIDCLKICSDYKECFKEENFDVQECARECAAESQDDEFEDRANDCAACSACWRPG